jgi:hypothetical protein
MYLAEVGQATGYRKLDAFYVKPKNVYRKCIKG